MKAEIAWQIPYKIYKILGTFDINDLGKITLNEYIEMFENNKLHRFPWNNRFFLLGNW